MKKLILLFCLILTFNVSFCEDTSVIIYCDDSYPPYSYLEDGIAKGLYIDILNKALTKVEGYKVKISPVPWKRGLALIKSGDGFALVPPYNKPLERPWMDCSAPIMDEEVVLIINDSVKGKNRKKWPEDFTDILIGINAGFLSIEQEERKKLKIDESAKESKINLIKFGMGRLDGYINDKISILDTIRKMKSSGEYKKEFSNVNIGHTLGKKSIHVGYTTSKLDLYPYKEDFKKKLDKAINEMKNSGEIKRMIEEYK